MAILPPQEWELSPKREVEPAKLVRDKGDELGKVMLALALAFNDLKGLVLFEQYLIAMGRPSADDWSERAGQWRGAAVQLHRWIAGVVHEVMVVIQKRRHVLTTAEARLVRDALSEPTRTAWDALVEVALDEKGRTATMLTKIRNNASFHYGPDALEQGYRRQFVEAARTTPHVANQSAQYSFGSDMDGTRFFYADAAAQQRMAMLGLQHDAPEADKRIVELAAAVNRTLGPLVAAFIRHRSAS